MMQLVFQQSQVVHRWTKTPINTPLQPKEDGGTRHPNTTDTTKQFLSTNPKAGDYLVVSSQPYVHRQTLNVQEVLDASSIDFTIHGIGPAANVQLPLKTFLDEVARTLAEEIKHQQ